MGIRVIDDHVVKCDSGRTVVFRDSAEGVEEETIAKFHDVSLVYTCHFLHINMIINVCNNRTEEGKLALRLFFNAKSNANREMRSALARVETFKLSTTPG